MDLYVGMDGWDWVTVISDRPTTIAPLKAVLIKRTMKIHHEPKDLNKKASK